MSVGRNWRTFCGGLALAIALAACETVPPPPLMSPLQVAKAYGYAEVPLGNARYDVTYAAPSRRSLRSPASLQATSAAGRTQAYDLALWRAAQLALAQGFTGFRASNVRTNTSTVLDDYYIPPYGPGFYPHHWPYHYPTMWDYPWGPSPYAYAQTAVTIEVQLLHNLGPGDYNAAEVIAQLRRTYPGAEGPPPPARPPS